MTTRAATSESRPAAAETLMAVPVAERPGWRAPTAAASAVAALAHVPVTADHLQEVFYVGVLFILLEVACAVVAVVLALRASRVAYLSAATVGTLAVAALLASRTVGLPMMSDDIGDWDDPLALVSLIGESLMIVAGVAGLFGSEPLSRRARVVGLANGLVVLVFGCLAIALASVQPLPDDAHQPGTSSDRPADTDRHDSHMDGMHIGLPVGPSAVAPT